MSTNLYVKIGDHLVLGRIIQSVYFHPSLRTVTITYLSGRKHTVITEEQFTLDDMRTILKEICDIHEASCYPSGDDESGCPLGMANL